MIADMGDWTLTAMRGVGAAVLLALFAGEALACSRLSPNMPPQLAMFPNEPAESYAERSKAHFEGFQAMEAEAVRRGELARQTELWTGARAVAVVEAVSVERDKPIGNPAAVMGTGSRVKVKVVSWIKGTGYPLASFQLAHKDFTSCGASPDWRVLRAEQGQRFVLFMKTGKPFQGDVLGEVEPSAILAPEILTALAMKAAR
jgi:hypothetical protein